MHVAAVIAKQTDNIQNKQTSKTFWVSTISLNYHYGNKMLHFFYVVFLYFHSSDKISGLNIFIWLERKFDRYVSKDQFLLIVNLKRLVPFSLLCSFFFLLHLHIIVMCYFIGKKIFKSTFDFFYLKINFIFKE